MPEEIYTTTPDCEIVNVRDVHADRNTVFRAWTDPEYLIKWWGPSGFTNTFHEFDLRPGGKWRFTMHGPDKGNYPNECEFIKIILPEQIAWTRHSKPLFQILVNFDEISKDVTRITFKMLFSLAEECKKIRAFAPEKNEENLDRLEDELKRMTTN
jgi:uncharacterized protein YndB with AHSA1/START domain